jgi:septal ring factor EnvC (AmiA/AmiB activator)
MLTEALIAVSGGLLVSTATLGALLHKSKRTAVITEPNSAERASEEHGLEAQIEKLKNDYEELYAKEQTLRRAIAEAITSLYNASGSDNAEYLDSKIKEVIGALDKALE